MKKCEMILDVRGYFYKHGLTLIPTWISNFDIIFKYQFGFRKGCSTYLALTVLMDKLAKSMENGDYVVGVFWGFFQSFWYG